MLINRVFNVVKRKETLMGNIRKSASSSPKKASSHSEAKAWFIWSFAALFYLYQFILRNFPGVMTEDLMRDFSVEACALGVMTACYLISYSALQIPVGLGLDKFGSTRFLRGAILLCVAGTFLFGVAQDFYMACLGRLLIGMGATCAFLGCVKLGTVWFPPQKLALVVGFTLLAGKIGAILGQAPLALLVEALGWRESLLYVLIPIGCLLTVGIFLFVEDKEVEIEPVQKGFSTFLAHLKTIVLDYRMWVLGIYGALMYCPLLAFVDLWGIPFLTKVYGIDRALAGLATTMFYIGIGIGSPVVAMISDSLKMRKIPMGVGIVLSIIFNMLIIYVSDIPLPVMYVLLFMAGVAFSAQPLIFSSACQLTPAESNGTAVSFINMLVMIFGLLLQPLIGKLLELSWGGEMLNGVPYYTVSDYRYALLSIPISLGIALFFMPLVPETFPRRKKS